MTTTVSEPAVDVASEEAVTGSTTESTDEVLADLLVEEISIDGMCGVY